MNQLLPIPTAVTPIAQPLPAAQLAADFARLHGVSRSTRSPDFAERRRDLQALKTLLLNHQDEIAAAISTDYGNRSYHETQFAELIAAADSINDALKHLKRWMRPQRRHVDLTMFPGARNRVIPQPLGVVGLIVPWNFPVNIAFGQLAAVLAAGNRAMVKMSENSVALTRLLQQLAPRYFVADKLAFYEETGGVGQEFSKLPFDLLIFTGSGQTGRAVMASAAANLTPVVLELGGKSPAVIAPDYPLARAVERILFVKQFNAGQICTSVDYVFVHQDQREEFVRLARAWATKHCPDIRNQDYTSIIDERSFARLNTTLDDARGKGATVINLLEPQQADPALRKLPLHLVLDSSADMSIRQRETFGPILLVLTYREPQEVIDYINNNDRPLALYPFTNDRQLQAFYIDRTLSGGVTVNDTLMHVAQHDLPFGGVGASGMGHYHGYEGFLACSKLRPVFYQARFSALRYLVPPYGQLATRVFDTLLKLKR